MAAVGGVTEEVRALTPFAAAAAGVALPVPHKVIVSPPAKTDER